MSQRVTVLFAFMLLVPGICLASDGPAATLGVRLDSLAERLSGEPTTRVIGSEEEHVHTVALAAGEYVEIAIAPRGADLAARLIAPDASILDESVPQPWRPIALRAIVSASGIYHVEVRATSSSSIDERQDNLVRGTYSIRVVERRPAVARDALRVRSHRLVAEAAALEADWTADSAAAARERLRAARVAAREAGDHRDLAIASAALSEAYHSEGRLATALRLSREALAEATLARDAVTQCRARIATGGVQADQGALVEAGRAADEALALGRAIPDAACEARALLLTGDIESFGGLFSESVRRYDAAAAVARAARDDRAEATARLDLAYSHADLRQIAAAEGEYRAALDLFRALNDLHGEAHALHGEAQLHLLVGEHGRALQKCRTSRALFERIGDREAIASTLTTIGVVYGDYGDPARAMGYYRDAAGLFAAIGQPGPEATCRLQQGKYELALRQPRRAARSFAAALDLARSVQEVHTQSRALAMLASTDTALGHPQQALSRFREARRLATRAGDCVGEMYADVGLSEFWATTGHLEEAGRVLDQALGACGGHGDPFELTRAAIAYARLERRRGHHEAALERACGALQMVDTLRTRVASLDMRSAYLASVRDAYELSIDLLMDANDASPGGDHLVRAFDVGERGRARAMLDGLAQAQGGLVEGAADDLLAQERRLGASMNAAAAGRLAALQRGRIDEATRMSRELDRLSAAHRDLEERIRAESPRYASLLEQAPLGLAEVQQLLDDNTILLQYFVGTQTSYVWIVTRAHVTARRLPGRAEISAVVRPYLAALGSPPQPGRSPADATRVATLLLPVELRISQHARVVIVPDGILHQVPFAALPLQHDDGPAASALVATREVVAVPSVSIVSLIRRSWQGPHEWPKPLLVFADPVFELDDPRLTGVREGAPGSGVAVPDDSNDEPLRRALRDVGLRQAASPPRLLAARREAAGIAAVVPGADIALGFAANRAAVTSAALGAYRIVHFATHGIIDNDRPELSGLVLSLVDERGTLQDGFVRLHDVYALRVPADLVVLSACRTALGADFAGEGLIGLVRGFMYAGSRRVVASLWKVDDEATSELMVRFYRAMVERKLAPPVALREAQLEIRAIARWSHPFYWAGFVLYGEWLE